ncbi:flagellar FlbD family protein [Amphibacillus jilinensis]|uniref:flagellar FlbD family protein n=1 Tax=Amphibacillus jilinensis TaxID=1216008 RepID=UPI0003170A44|nr:flagellar FlbD family protein [Amphibacillus jilinensis]
MIELTNFKGETFTLNAYYIERIQSFPDTTITLVNGKKMVVRETEKEVRELSIQFYQAAGINRWQEKVGEHSE